MVKAKLSSAPFRPAEKFLKWIEFAAEFPDLTELNLAGAELNFCVYHSLDVLALAAAAVLAILAVGYYITVTNVVRIWQSLMLSVNACFRRWYIAPKQKSQ